MIENMETPAKLAAGIIADFRQGAESILDACSKIANAWEAVEEGGPWSEDKFVTFIDRLAEAKIGPGSAVFYVEGKKGIVFKKSAKAGVYYQLMAVGACPVFSTKEFRQINRIVSYSVLYRLSVLYNTILKNGSGSEKQRSERANKQVLELVRNFGALLTREVVNDAISKIGPRASHAPSEKEADTVATASFGSSMTIDEVVEREERYDFVLLTPNEDALIEAASCSPSTLMDRAPYQELMKSKSRAVLIGSGRHLDGMKSLARVSGNLNRIYCIRQSNDKSQVIDISNELLVFTNSALDMGVGPKKGEDTEQFVRRLVLEAAPEGRKLHLFADEEAEGWDTVGSSNSLKEG